MVVWSLGKATKLFDVHVFFTSMKFIRIYRLRFGDFLSICYTLCWVLQNTIMLSIFLGSMSFSILIMIFFVKYCKTFSFWFIKNAAKLMALTWGQVAYYIIVTTTTHFESDQVFLVSIHLANQISNYCFLPTSRLVRTSPLINFGDFCQPPCLSLVILAEICEPPRYSALTFYLKLESITEHPKTSQKLSKTIRQAKKVGSNISLYSDTKKGKKFSKEKKWKNKKAKTCFRGVASSYNVEILNYFNLEV